MPYPPADVSAHLVAVQTLANVLLQPPPLEDDERHALLAVLKTALVSLKASGCAAAASRIAALVIATAREEPLARAWSEDVARMVPAIEAFLADADPRRD